MSPGIRIRPGEEPELEDGVRGAVFDREDGLWIPLIRAEEPGSGDVGRFLDGLPRDRRIVFPNVLSDRLRGMLERRGFEEGREWIEDVGEEIPVMEREAEA